MTTLDDINYAQDARTQGAAKRPVLYLETGEEIELPIKWTVCQVCNGEGKHVNPSIDAGGLSPDDMDPDFTESYMRGDYDVTCNRCNGRTTVPTVDLEHMTPEHKHLYAEQLRAEDDDRATYLAELRAGA